MDIVDQFQLKFFKHDFFYLKRSTMTSLVYGETGRYPLSISVIMPTIRFWASLDQSPVPNCSTDVYFAMRGFFERGIVRSPWLDHVKLILIISGFDCVWESEPFQLIRAQDS